VYFNNANNLIVKPSPLVLGIALFLSVFTSNAQINFEAFQIEIKKTNEPIVIDGVLDEKTWSEASVGKDFFYDYPCRHG